MERRQAIIGKRWLMLVLVVGLLASFVVAPVYHAQGPVNVSQSEQDSRAAAVAITPAGTVHVVWEEPDGLYHRWMRGSTWSAPQRISLDGAHPVLLVDQTQSDVVYLAWDEPFGETRDVFVRRWEGNGWSLPRNISQSDGYSTQPSLAQYPDGRFVLVWTDTTPGSPTLYRAESTDGVVWTNIAPIVDFVGTNPQVQVVDGTEHLVWMYRAGFRQPRRLLWSYRNGDTWSLPEVLSVPTRSVEGASTMVLGSDLWLTWSELGDVKVRVWQLNQGWGDTFTLALGATGTPVWAPFNSAVHLLWPDETVIARAWWRNGQWSAPQTWWAPDRPVDDIAVASTGQRAVIVWSQRGDTAWDVLLDVWTATRLWVPFLQ